MQAVNYPATTLAPPTREQDDPGPFEPLEHRRPYRRIATIGGASLALLLVGFLLGRFLIGSAVSPGLSNLGLGGFAEMYVSTLLTQAGEGNEDVLVPYLGFSPDLTHFEPGAWYVSQTAVWSVEATGSNRWTVLVGAAQLGLQQRGYVPVGTFFYRVEIEQTPGGLRAMALPALVPAPSPPLPPASEAPDIDAGLADAIAEHITTQFTEANTTPFETPPFDTVTVGSISLGETNGDHLQIDVEFIGVDEAGRATPLAYRLEVSTVDWSVVETGDPGISPRSS